MQEIWIDQEDAALLQDGEEVTLMDWGNAVIEVHCLLVTPHFYQVSQVWCTRNPCAQSLPSNRFLGRSCLIYTGDSSLWKPDWRAHNVHLGGNLR